MLHLALVAVLLALTPFGPDGDKDKDKKKSEQDVLTVKADADDDNIINDTYSFGPSAPFPLKLWVGYAWAADEDAYTSDGDKISDTTDPALVGATGNEFGSVTAQRAFVGAQINVINFPRFAVGVGGQLTAGKVEVEDLFVPEGVAVTPTGVVVTRANAESDFKLQNGKVYGVIKGDVLGIHGGYVFDLEDDDVRIFNVGTEGVAFTDEIPITDQADAWFVGVDFDYPGKYVRVFAGADYFNRDFGDATPGSIEDDELIVAVGGMGLRIAFVEIGAAALIRTNLDRNRFDSQGDLAVQEDGGYQASIAPFLNLSPRQLPFAISVKGAFLSEYADYGYSIGGNDDLVTREGFTVTASLGF